MIKMRWAMLIWLICATVGGVCHFSTAHAATEILGTTSNGDSGTSTLVRINTDNWTERIEVGQVGYLVNGMAWDNDSKKLYASTSTNDPAFTGLITINTDTGEGTPIGTTDDWGQAAGYSVSNITIDSDGTLWGWADNSNQPVIIDKETGTIVRTINATVPATTPGLSFDRIDLLFLIDGTGNLYVLDDNDTFQGPGGDHTTMARQGDFHPSSNVYYGIIDTGTIAREIVLIDVYPTTGNTLQQYPTIDQLHTLVFTTTSDSGGGSSNDSGNCFIRSIHP